MIRSILMAIALLIGASFVSPVSAQAQVPPVGTRCISQFYTVENKQINGTNAVVFEQGGVHRWRLQGDARPVFDSGAVDMGKLSDLKTSSIETGSYTFGGKTWTMRSMGHGHIWYGNWNGTTLDAAADVSGEYPQMGHLPILNRNVDCSGKRAFKGL